MHPPAAPRTDAIYLRPLVRLLDDRRFDADALLADHGLTRADLARTGTRVDVAVTSRILESACVATGDPALGLSLVRYGEYAAFGPLGVALAAGGSLRAVLVRITRFHAVVSDALASRLDESGGTLAVEFLPQSDAAPHPQSVLFTMASLVGFVRLRLTRSTNPTQVVLRDADDACLAAAARYFRCPVVRGPTSRIDYPSDSGTEMLTGSDPEMAELLERALRSRLSDAERPLALELAIWIEARLPEGEPTLAEAARSLATSERSLQRRLRAEGRSWRSIVDDTRRALVERHPHTPGMSLTELSFLLGFADATSFSRAFRNWYGVSASDVRKNGRPASPRDRRR